MILVRQTLIIFILLKKVESAYVDSVSATGNVHYDQVIQQLVARVNSLEVRDKMLQNKIVELESRNVEHTQRFAALGEVVSSQQQHVHNLEEVIRSQQHQFTDLEDVVKSQQQQIHHLEDVVRSQQQQVTDLEDVVRSQQLQVCNLEDVVRNQQQMSQPSSPIVPTNVHDGGPSLADDNIDWTTISVAGSGMRRQVNANKPAFTVILTHNLPNLGDNQVVHFDRVETNIGNAYNTHLGLFIAPVSGTYVFFISIKSPSSRSAWCSIVVNGDPKVDAFTFGTINNYGTGSQMLVVSLNQGDDVTVQNKRDDDMLIGQEGFTTFSGFLLY